jgi:hypothetical protein
MASTRASLGAAAALIRLLVSLLLVTGIARAEPAKSDPDRIRELMAHKHAGRQWKVGPQRVDTPALRGAYPSMRFYFVFSPAPMPGGVRRPDFELAAERDAFERNWVSATLSVDANGKVREISSPADLNVGLTPARTEHERLRAAAAIASLVHLTYFAPQTFTEDHVHFLREDPEAGRLYNAEIPGQAVVTVGFDRAGHCSHAAGGYTGPMPP